MNLKKEKKKSMSMCLRQEQIHLIKKLAKMESKSVSTFMENYLDNTLFNKEQYYTEKIKQLNAEIFLCTGFIEKLKLDEHLKKEKILDSQEKFRNIPKNSSEQIKKEVDNVFNKMGINSEE